MQTPTTESRTAVEKSGRVLGYFLTIAFILAFLYFFVAGLRFLI